MKIFRNRNDQEIAGYGFMLLRYTSFLYYYGNLFGSNSHFKPNFEFCRINQPKNAYVHTVVGTIYQKMEISTTSNDISGGIIQIGSQLNN